MKGLLNETVDTFSPSRWRDGLPERLLFLLADSAVYRVLYSSLWELLFPFQVDDGAVVEDATQPSIRVAAPLTNLVECVLALRELTSQTEVLLSLLLDSLRARRPVQCWETLIAARLVVLV